MSNKSMAKIVTAVVTVMLIFGVTIVSLEKFAQKAVPASNLSPLFKGKTVDGFSYDYSPTNAERTLLVFFASWCTPCVQETPSLIQLARRYGTWKIILISRDSVKSELMNFIKIFPNLRQNNITVIWDAEGDIAELYKVKALPESFLVQRDGIILNKIIGAMDWNSL